MPNIPPFGACYGSPTSLFAAARLGIRPADCVAIEDSNNGVTAAVSAGMKCEVTVTDCTRDEDFSRADIVSICLGDPDGEVSEVLANRSNRRKLQ